MEDEENYVVTGTQVSFILKINRKHVSCAHEYMDHMINDRKMLNYLNDCG